MKIIRVIGWRGSRLYLFTFRFGGLLLMKLISNISSQAFSLSQRAVALTLRRVRFLLRVASMGEE